MSGCVGLGDGVLGAGQGPGPWADPEQCETRDLLPLPQPLSPSIGPLYEHLPRGTFCSITLSWTPSSSQPSYDVSTGLPILWDKETESRIYGASISLARVLGGTRMWGLGLRSRRAEAAV